MYGLQQVQIINDLMQIRQCTVHCTGRTTSEMDVNAMLENCPFYALLKSASCILSTLHWPSAIRNKSNVNIELKVCIVLFQFDRV